jgi:hypothetical protein
MENLLARIPQVDRAVIPIAVSTLIDAADQYMADRPIVDKAGRRSKPGIAEARASVRALQKSLSLTEDQLDNLPLNALTAITEALKGPLGKSKAEVARLHSAVKKASASLAREENKTRDVARNVLAGQVAVVFRDILAIKPASTRDDATNVTGKQGGAAYATVLRATLVIAGVSQVKLGPLIDIGLEQLADLDLPHNLK